MKASSVGANQGGAQRAKVSEMTGQREAGSMQGILRRHSNDSGKDGVMLFLGVLPGKDSEPQYKTYLNTHYDCHEGSDTHLSAAATL